MSDSARLLEEARRYAEQVRGGVVLSTHNLALHLDELAAELQRLREALERIKANAESWHGDDAAKGRALTVIAGWADAALAGSTAAREMMEET